MKKILTKTLMIVAMAATLVACEKDETTSPSNTNSSQLVGTWDATLDIDKFYSSGILLSTDTTVYDSTLSGILTLNSNGTGLYISNDNGNIDTSNFNYSVSGNTISTFDATDTITANYTLNGNALSITAELVFGTEKFVTESRYTKR